MSNDNSVGTETIGETAGMVWHALSEHGPMSLTKLVKQIATPHDTVMQAIGWLAREGKIQISGTPRGRTVSLR